MRLFSAFLLALLLHGALLCLAVPRDWLMPPRLPSADQVTVSLAVALVVSQQKPVPESLALLQEEPDPKERVQPEQEVEPAMEEPAAPAPVVSVRPGKIKKRIEPEKQRPHRLPDREPVRCPAPVAPAHTPAADSASSVASAAGVHQARPLYRFNPPPEYPALARRRGWQGTVRIRVMVRRDGSVAMAVIHRSSGHALLDRSALASIRRWRFAPGTKGGRAVETEVIVPIHFELK